MSDLSDSVDWDARADDVLADQISAYDRMRSRCPVARDESGHWSLFTHGDVVSALKDHDAFSNAVSVHVAVPNGMDPPEHTSFRELVDGYYTPERLTDFEPVLRDIAIRTIDGIPRGEPVEVLSMLAEPFAIAVQNAFTRRTRPQSCLKIETRSPPSRWSLILTFAPSWRSGLMVRLMM